MDTQQPARIHPFWQNSGLTLNPIPYIIGTCRCMPGWWNGRHKGLKNPGSQGVRVRVPPRALRFAGNKTPRGATAPRGVLLLLLLQTATELPGTIPECARKGSVPSAAKAPWLRQDPCCGPAHRCRTHSSRLLFWWGATQSSRGSHRTSQRH